mmetsp:Transcript_32827/g.76952  ORF Transcript_32827/g.76952 Transcript_32827/m.76952 type:complete len:146 (+) Transcript_32827:539-976(+)
MIWTPSSWKYRSLPRKSTTHASSSSMGCRTPLRTGLDAETTACMRVGFSEAALLTWRSQAARVPATVALQLPVRRDFSDVRLRLLVPLHLQSRETVEAGRKRMWGSCARDSMRKWATCECATGTLCCADGDIAHAIDGTCYSADS